MHTYSNYRIFCASYKYLYLNCCIFDIQIYSNICLMIKIYLHILYFFCLSQNATLRAYIPNFFTLAFNIIEYLFKLWPQIYWNICSLRFRSFKYIWKLVWTLFSNICSSPVVLIGTPCQWHSLVCTVHSVELRVFSVYSEHPALNCLGIGAFQRYLRKITSEWLKYLSSYDAACKTAPATPCLFNTWDSRKIPYLG